MWTVNSIVGIFTLSAPVLDIICGQLQVAGPWVGATKCHGAGSGLVRTVRHSTFMQGRSS